MFDKVEYKLIKERHLINSSVIYQDELTFEYSDFYVAADAFSRVRLEQEKIIQVDASYVQLMSGFLHQSETMFAQTVSQQALVDVDRLLRTTTSSEGVGSQLRMLSLPLYLEHVATTQSGTANRDGVIAQWASPTSFFNNQSVANFTSDASYTGFEPASCISEVSARYLWNSSSAYALTSSSGAGS
jgi:hypothetical protein